MQPTVTETTITISRADKTVKRKRVIVSLPQPTSTRLAVEYPQRLETLGVDHELFDAMYLTWCIAVAGVDEKRANLAYSLRFVMLFCVVFSIGFPLAALEYPLSMMTALQSLVLSCVFLTVYQGYRVGTMIEEAQTAYNQRWAAHGWKAIRLIPGHIELE